MTPWPSFVSGIREVRWGTIGLYLVVQTVVITSLVIYRLELLVPIASATGWLIQPDLITGAVLMLVVLGDIIIRHGGLRLSDVGLIGAKVPLAAGVTAALWLLTQIVLIFASLLESGTLHCIRTGTSRAP